MKAFPLLYFIVMNNAEKAWYLQELQLNAVCLPNIRDIFIVQMSSDWWGVHTF